MDTERTEDTWQDDPTEDVTDDYDAAAYPEDYDDETLIYGDDEGESNPRRGQAATAMVLAGLFFIFSLVVLASFNVESGAFGQAFAFWALRTWVWIFLVVMVIFLVWLVLLLVATPPRGEEDWYSDEDAEHPTAAYADEPGGADTISLRCPRCVTIFTLQDPWARPFYHVCPNCEVRGVYTGEQDPPEVKAALENRHEGGYGA